MSAERKPVDAGAELARVIRILERDGDEHDIAETLHAIGTAVQKKDAAVVELVEKCEAFERKFWEIAERHDDRTCDEDVCVEVREFRAALAAAREGV